MGFIGIILVTVLFVILYDIFNNKHAVKNNFPLIGRLRYFLESIGPEIRQYFVAGNREERPFNRVWRNYIYASAKGENNLTGFGSDADFNKSGHFFIKHSAFPLKKKNHSEIKCAKLIGPRRRNPYRPQSVINISGMSYGSLGKRATKLNNIGARLAGAYHNIGEGGYSEEYHGNGADVVFQVGTGYFGCNATYDGKRSFNYAVLMGLVIDNRNIKMIEIKLSQGAKPSKGGILPGEKVTADIARIRGIEKGKTVYSSAYHTAFDDVEGLIKMIEEIAKNTGLPVGIKSAVGKVEFWKDLAIEIKKTGNGPDFITIDGGEGGTGAAPAAFADNMSLPFDEAFTSVYKVFKFYDIEKNVVWIASGKLGHPTRAVKAFAMGADLINIAREVMLSAGCIQAQRCHTGNCPTGLATHKWWLEKGVNVEEKSKRVGMFIKTLRKDLLEVTHACGYEHPSEFQMEDVVINVGDSKKTMNEIYGYEK